MLIPLKNNVVDKTIEREKTILTKIFLHIKILIFPKGEPITFLKFPAFFSNKLIIPI